MTDLKAYSVSFWLLRHTILYHTFRGTFPQAEFRILLVREFLHSAIRILPVPAYYIQQSLPDSASCTAFSRHQSNLNFRTVEGHLLCLLSLRILEISLFLYIILYCPMAS